MAEHTKLNFDWSKAVCWPTGDDPKQSFDIEGPTPAVAGLTEPEVLPIDQLGRADTARFLTELAKIKKAGYVLNLNCPWGTGKTWFLKRWLLTLQNQHPVVYIDAWKYDHNDSPLLIILQHIIKTLQEQSPQAKRLGDRIKTSKGFATAKVLGPELVKAVFRVDLEKVMNSADFEAKNSASAIADLASKTTAMLLDNVSKETEAVDDLKLAIAKLLDSIIGQKAKTNLNYPLFVFVDELDRCRPTFAIEMLEAIKHVFGIPQIFFVIATDSEQLQHSISAVYGEKFGSYNYLKRFFDASFQLETPEPQSFISAQSEFSDIFKFYSSYDDLYDINDQKKLAEVFATISKAFSVELRTIKQWLGRIQICCLLSSEQMKKLPFWGVAFVSLIKIKDIELYSLIKNEFTTIGQISKSTDKQLSEQIINLRQNLPTGRDKHQSRFFIQEKIHTEHILSWFIDVLTMLHKIGEEYEKQELTGYLSFSEFKEHYYEKLSQPKVSLLHHVNRLLEFTEQLHLD